MLRAAGFALAFGLALVAVLASWRTSPPVALPIVFHGDDAEGVAAAHAALDRVFATATGARARARIASGALAQPLTIELNHEGANYTAYRVPGRELGETIYFDPSSQPLVATERGSEPAHPETVLAHELGHAVFKLRSEQEVIDAVENPVRDELGLPRRSRF